MSWTAGFLAKPGSKFHVINLNFADFVKTVKINRGKGGNIMAVEKTGEKYRCNICGNEVITTKVGGGTLVCCGEDMEKIEG